MTDTDLPTHGRSLRGLLLAPVVVVVGALGALGMTLAPAGATENPSTTMQPLMSAGAEHTCAIIDGAAKCWGLNFYGELGNGSNGSPNPNPTPTQVTGLTSNVTAISAGSLSHTCAIVDGAAKCWGLNYYGELGDGSTADKYTPTQVTGLTSNVTAISAGRYHTCAIVGGAAKCWGDGESYQLGNSSDDACNTPVQVTGLTSNVTAISAGGEHTCAIVGGAAKCWGSNGDRQLGDGTTISRDAPVTVSGLTSNVTAISAGRYHTCAIVGGAAKCWGNNDSGQIGDGTITMFGVTITSNRNAPVQVDGLTSNVTAISTGVSHTCAIVGEAAKCWGDNQRGQVGDGTTTTRITPVNVTGFATAFATTTTTTTTTTPTVVLPPALPALVNAPVATTTTAAPPDTAPPTEPPATTAPTGTAPSPTEPSATTVPAPALSVVLELPVAASPIVADGSVFVSAPITVSFGGFTPFEFVQLIVASTPKVIGSGYADAQGVVTISGTLPADLDAGAHTLAVYAPASGVGFAQPIMVASPTLPSTGSPGGHMGAMVALCALLVGLAALVAGRRRVA